MKDDAYLISPPRRVRWWGSLDEHPQPASSLTRNSRNSAVPRKAQTFCFLNYYYYLILVTALSLSFLRPPLAPVFGLCVIVRLAALSSVSCADLPTFVLVPSSSLLPHCKAPCLYNKDYGVEVPASLAGRPIRPADYLVWRSPI